MPDKPVNDMTIEELRKEVNSYRLLMSFSNTKGNTVMEQFAAFYKLYPRKVGRRNAEKAWVKLAKQGRLTEEIITVIMEAVTLQAQFCGPLSPKEDGTKTFIPHPASWLNGECWDDEVDVVVSVDPVASKEISEAQGDKLWE